ncbi:MAG: hypothetical protein ACD_45C00232G0003 [uncultured bacterium]|nr:MAG: hypothetical protein ACD_45C00232G0003 [uncultured bacterium]
MQYKGIDNVQKEKIPHPKLGLETDSPKIF